MNVLSGSSEKKKKCAIPVQSILTFHFLNRFDSIDSIGIQLTYSNTAKIELEFIAVAVPSSFGVKEFRSFVRAQRLN